MNIKVLLSLGAIALAGPVLSAHAQYFDDFNTGTDANWTRWTPRATATVTFPTLSPGNLGYELADAPGTSSFFTTARVASYVTGIDYQDFSVSADLVNWNGSDEMQMGVLGRVQAPIPNSGAFPGAYALVYVNRFSVRGSGTDQLRILQLGPSANNYINDGLGNQGQFGVVAGGSAAPQPGGQYRLFLTGSGYSFTGKIMDLSTGTFMTFNDGNGNLTDTIHATDPNSTWGHGSVGLGTFVNTVTPGVDTTFDNFSAIPEPSSVALAMIGSAGFLFARRQRQTR